MVAIVATVGGMLLFQGMNGITAFNNYLQNALTTGSDSARESFFIEHVRFTPQDGVKTIDIWIRNTGTVDIEIDKITLLRIDTQELLIYDNTVDKTIAISAIENITLTAVFPSESDWNVIGADEDYKISATTTKGNSRESTITTFNT